ncbi:hypothetical protein AMK59_5037 [Oryctes borbonicus]|uniref:Mss4-like protein n=1 Tax=Oryctes borbonicus TaxID=1629725 RepID=A0A0T6B0I0_9SCAR|nr:hypothetical protein AMK59_5037 [Oryctes borbonicus]
MPENSTDYAHEIDNGRNLRSVICKYCTSVILTPLSASISYFEFDLPLMSQKKNDGNIETETVSTFWIVNDMFTFQNVGFSHTIEDKKYLTCADCEAGPIGYHDLSQKKSYVALSRVIHS